MNNTFTVGANQAGKSLQDLYGESSAAGQYVPDLGTLQQLTGIDPNAKLTAGQNIAFNKNDPGSGEYKYLSSVFGNPISGGQAAQNSAQAAYQPAINTLTAAKDPLKERYDSLIASINSTRDQAKQQAGINAAQEFGKRGLSVNSGQYNDFLANKYAPIDTQFTGLATSATGEQVDKETQLSQAIAQLQSGAAGAGIQANQFAENLANNVGQSNTSNALEQAKLDFQKSQAGGNSNANYDIVSAGGQVYLYDKTTGKYSTLDTGNGGGFNASDWN